MTTETIAGVSLTTKANVYFDGKCVSHSFTLADGTKKSVGVVLPATLTFGTAAAEIMECVGGSCEYKLDGSDEWKKSSAGESFQIPANSKFDIRVTEVYLHLPLRLIRAWPGFGPDPRISSLFSPNRLPIKRLQLSL